MKGQPLEFPNREIDIKIFFSTTDELRQLLRPVKTDDTSGDYDRATLTTPTKPSTKRRNTRSAERSSAAVTESDIPENKSTTKRLTRSSARKAASNSSTAAAAQSFTASSIPSSEQPSSTRPETQTSDNPQPSSLEFPNSISRRGSRRVQKTHGTTISSPQTPVQPPSATSLKRKSRESPPSESLNIDSTLRKSKRPRRHQESNSTPRPVSSRARDHILSVATMDNQEDVTMSSPGGSSRKRNVSKNTSRDSLPGPSSSSHSGKEAPLSDQDTAMTGTSDPASEDEDHDLDHEPEDDENDENQGTHDENDSDEDGDEDDEDDHHGSRRRYRPNRFDPFNDSVPDFDDGLPDNLTQTLRVLSGMMGGRGSRFKDIIKSLQSGEEYTQMAALQDLSEILLVSSEDHLVGQLQPDHLVTELVNLMQHHSPEIMLLACRCLANLMEALPSSVHSVVYGGAVPVLCSKLLEISYIDVAEQSLSTLEKISHEFPGAIVKEGGLTACLSYLDFFATSTQRTAVTTAANCCRNIHADSFPVVRDCMPKLLDVLGSSDQRVVEQASLCVSGIVESFKFHPSKLEDLVTVDLLRAVLRLLVPGTTNLIRSSIHTQFLRVLAHTARASPRLSAELFKLNVVETLYQMLTGVSPPAENSDVASKLDSVVIMQALIHRSRSQIMETLNVVCELLPSEPNDNVEDLMNTPRLILEQRSNKGDSEKRIEFLKECPNEVRRFAQILFPTLADAFSSTINLEVRQRVMIAHIKMLSNLEQNILLETLSTLPYASFLASIFSQQDHYTLVSMALESSSMLLRRLGDVYRYQLYREGVINEITKIAETAVEEEELPVQGKKKDPIGNLSSSDDDESDVEITSDIPTSGPVIDLDVAEHYNDGNDTSIEEDHDYQDNEDREEEEEDHHREEDDDETESRSSRDSDDSDDHHSRPIICRESPQLRLHNQAKKFLEIHETEKQNKQMKKKATKILTSLAELSKELEDHFLTRTASDLSPETGKTLFNRLAIHFDGDVLESITSAEILASSLVKTLLDIFGNPNEELARAAQAIFLEVFMGNTAKTRKTGAADSPSTAFSSMIHKLQDVLSRSEHFEVTTVQQGPFESGRSSSASFLAKQIKLRLVADESSNVPRAYRNLMVSIHAIATFQSLADYLRPRITQPDHMTNLSSMFGSLRGSDRSLMQAGALAQLLSDSFDGPPGAGDMSRRRGARRLGAGTSSGDILDALIGRSSGNRSRAQEHTSSRSNKPTADSSRAEGDDHSMQDAEECEDDAENTDPSSRESSQPHFNEQSAFETFLSSLRTETDEAPGSIFEGINSNSFSNPFATLTRGSDGASTSTGTVRQGQQSRDQPSDSFPRPHSRRDSASRSGPAEASPAGNIPTAPASSSTQTLVAARPTTPKEWHIEFIIDGNKISNDVSVFQAIFNSSSLEGRSVWNMVHEVKYRRVEGPAPSTDAAEPPATEINPDATSVPASLSAHPTTSSVLRLLRILHDLNINIEDVLAENSELFKLNVEPLSQFVNTKLTAKLNRQLEEPLIVASNCLPSWVEDLARCYPFLFPFDTRHLFLQSTSFGYARSMARWQSNHSDDRRPRDEFLGRLQRQKVRIGRIKMFESALKVMNLYGTGQSILEIEYFEEVGTGLGPTLEFYATISREFSKRKLKLWRENDITDDAYVNSASGLFPKPFSQEELSGPNGVRILHMFTMLGKFVARSMLDSRLIDINFNPNFFRVGESGVRPSFGAIKSVDPALAQSLKLIKRFVTIKKEIEEDPTRTPAQKVADIEHIMVDNCRIDDLFLDFTLPGYPEIELQPNGADINVTMANIDLYLDRVVDMTLGSGVRHQIEAFKSGFTLVFPYSALNAFTPDELVKLFGRSEEDWSLETLMDSIKADHGFNMDSPSIKNLLQLMSNFTPNERRDFLQFTTGSPKLPIGGFKVLKPMFTVVCRPSEHPYTPDDYLPSVMTCANYLKLPNYSSIDIMRQRLAVATKEGQGAFHLS